MNRHGERAAQAQADVLLNDISGKVDATCAAILADAHREGEAARLRAREKARRQLQRAVAEMRATGQRRHAQLSAEQETQRGRRRAELALQVLDDTWPALAEAIARRWGNTTHRQAWITAQVDLATRRFGSRPWIIRHPATWPADDVQALRAALARRGVTAAELKPDGAPAVGLVIEVDGARLDSSPAALLADRPAVQALLLAAITQKAEKAPGHE